MQLPAHMHSKEHTHSYSLGSRKPEPLLAPSSQHPSRQLSAHAPVSQAQTCRHLFLKISGMVDMKAFVSYVQALMTLKSESVDALCNSSQIMAPNPPGKNNNCSNATFVRSKSVRCCKAYQGSLGQVKVHNQLTPSADNTTQQSADICTWHSVTLYAHTPQSWIGGSTAGIRHPLPRPHLIHG
eukprot:1155595-Pelagomonas_calceolata.AAC.3